MGTTLPRYRALVQEQPLTHHHRSIMSSVTRLGFTLAADMARLRRFVDSFLNFVDDDYPPPFHFEPAAPFVLFELLYYPYLAVASRNLVSYPQREMSFSIPLRCYAVEDGVLTFKQYAVCAPFLYVDEELSIVSGRDLFGLPKTAFRFERLESEVRPDAQRQVARLTLRMPSARGDRYMPFIEILRHPSRFASVRRSSEDLITALPDALRGYSLTAIQAWQAIVQPPIMGYERLRDLRSLWEMARINAEQFFAGSPLFPFYLPAPEIYESSADISLGPLSTDIISLKQARDAEHKELVSFQSLVKSTMYLDRLNDAGLLFSPLSGDPTGEVTVRIHHIPGQSLVESLGLLVDDTYEMSSPPRSAPKFEPPFAISTVRPFFPYWINVNMAYGLGINLYWRGRDNDWSASDYPGFPTRSRNRYLTFGGGALQEEASRFVSPDSTIWILILPIAQPDHLETLCAKYLNNDRYHFRLAGREPRIWMSIRKLLNSGEGQGLDKEQEVEFAALVEWFDMNAAGTGGRAQGAAFIPLYVLTDNQATAFTESEVFGRPTVRADVDFSNSDWTSLKMTGQMRVKTVVLPELYSGSTPGLREVVRVEVDFPTLESNASGGSPQQRQPDNGSLIEALSFPSVSLKQIADCRLPGHVNYQAIVMRVLEMKPKKPIALKRPATRHAPFLDPRFWSVRIPRYNSLPLVETMGLKVDHPDIDQAEDGPDTTIEVIKPLRVYAIRASVTEKGALNVAWRLGNSRWRHCGDLSSQLEKIRPEIGSHMDLMRRLESVFASWSRFSMPQQ